MLAADGKGLAFDRPRGASMYKTCSLVFAAFLLSQEVSAQAPSGPAPAISPEMYDPGPNGVRIDQDGIYANFYRGRGEDRRPGILLLAGSEGGLGAGTSHIAEMLAGEGFSVLQICYFGCPGLSSKLANVPLETFSRGLTWLRHQPGIDSGRIAVMGGSKGAEAALLLASRDSGLKAVVATQPTSVVWPGITFTAQMQPGWTEGGQAVAYLPYANVSIAERGLFARYNEALPAIAQYPDAVIPVEHITAKIMLVCGEADTLWPSCPMADQIAARLLANSRPAPLILRYPDAGHEVFGLPIDKTSPFYSRLGSLGGSPEGIAAAHSDNWPRTIAFLRQTLS
jgi:dienelactone hydrolase